MEFRVCYQESMIIPIWIFIGFQQRDRQYSQDLNKDTFCRLPITSAQCVIGTEKRPDAGIFLNYDDDDCSQAYGMIKEDFRVLTRYDILQASTPHHDFRSSIVRADDVGYNFYVLDIRYQQKFKLPTN